MIRRIFAFCVCAGLCAGFFSGFALAKKKSNSSDYPELRGERELREMGSVFGQDFVLKPGKFFPDTTKKSVSAEAGNVNLYLWNAALESTAGVPLQYLDVQSGVIITDWYSAPGGDNRRFKLNIFIKDDVIRPQAIEVRMFERKFSGKIWKDVRSKGSRINNKAANALEAKIIRQAREMYQKASAKPKKKK